MLYAGDGFVIEAVSDGVRKSDLQAIALKDATLAICLRRRNMDDAKRAAVIQAASEYIGRPYDSFGAASSGISNQRGMTLALGLLGPLGTVAMRALSNRPQSRDNSFFCSELVARAYERAGVRISQLEANQTNPRNLRVSTSLIYVGHLLGLD